jgi:hypothetical protein
LLQCERCQRSQFWVRRLQIQVIFIPAYIWVQRLPPWDRPVVRLFLVAVAAYPVEDDETTMGEITGLPDAYQATDAALTSWRQGDVIFDAGFSMMHLALAGRPLTPAARETANELPGDSPDDLLLVASETPGFVVLTQTCDLVRGSEQRPYVEMAPLRKVDTDILAQVRRCRIPALAYVPALADRELVVDLERTMTLEKAVLASLTFERGLNSDAETAAFQSALARKRQRFAFPDVFNRAIEPFQRRMIRRAGKSTPEGRHVDALVEIRAAAVPTWEASEVAVTLWLIKGHDPDKAEWMHWLSEWEKLIDQGGQYQLDGPLQLCTLDDMRASEYVASHRLDLDQLSL